MAFSQRSRPGVGVEGTVGRDVSGATPVPVHIASPRRGVPLDLRVVVVTADVADLELIRFHLASRGQSSVQLVHAGCEREALKEVRARQPDVVLIDPVLPDSAGPVSLQRLRNAAPEVPILVLTDGAAAPEIAAVLGAGAEAYIDRGDLDGRLVEHALFTAVARHRAMADLRRRERRLDMVLRGTNDGFWDWNLIDDEVYYSARWNGMLGYPAMERVAGPEMWFERVHADDLPGLRRTLDAHRSGLSRSFEHEHRIRTASGAYMWMLARGVVECDLEGRTRRIAGTHTDITARKRTERQLLVNSLHDELTGLPNRALFLDRLDVALSALRRQRRSDFAVLFLDLDRFKNVNDRCGHAVGDELLSAVGRRLRDFLRPCDTVARLSGDEFAILLGDVRDPTHAVHVAERVQDVVALPFRSRGRRVTVTASIGIAMSTTGYERSHDVLHDADVAMYRAKAGGGGRCEVFDAAMHLSAQSTMRVESDLREAVKRKLFVMHYQPVVDLRSGKVAGVEAMVRWDHPERGLVTPTDFLAVAEESGLIVPIGWWVIQRACAQVVDWQRRFLRLQDLWISVNVSAKLLVESDTVDRMRRILEECGLESSRLRIEVTEDAIIDCGEVALEKLRALRELGILICIDDFGSGFSSLTHLHEFRYDGLKIAPSFAASIEDGGRELVITMLNVARQLGMDAIAEGIETASQAKGLLRLNCPHGQGFWFARPTRADDVTRLLTGAPARWKLDA